MKLALVLLGIVTALSLTDVTLKATGTSLNPKCTCDNCTCGLACFCNEDDYRCSGCKCDVTGTE